MAGLGLEPEGHTRIVPCHNLVEETLGLHGKALAPRAAVYVPAASVGLLGVSA